MTPDLERAAKAAWEAVFPDAPTPDDLQEDARVVTAALRALLAPNSAVVEAMAQAIYRSHYSPTPLGVSWENGEERLRDIYRKAALAAWCAGFNAILAAEEGE